MAIIGIVTFTKTDITGQLVQSAIQGIKEAGATVLEHQITGSEIIEGRYINKAIFDDLKRCDAIIFASPTYMGGPAAQFKAFADATSDTWTKQDWAGKLAAGITSGTGLNGDQSSTLQYFMTLASQHGMLWVSIDAAFGYGNHGINRLSSQLGVVAQTNSKVANAIDLSTAKYLGGRVANFVINNQ